MSNTSISTTNLIGDWTLTGIVQQVASLTKFENNAVHPGDTVVIDCSGIDRIDLNGFQLLYVWIHCIQLRGFHPELVNMPQWMCEAQERERAVRAIENELHERGSV